MAKESVTSLDGLSPQERQAFYRRRDEARFQINAMDKDVLHDAPERQQFFNAVYERAAGDPAFVPWADLCPKNHLVQWLEENTGINVATGKQDHESAIDVACGLGDNAEVLAAAGYLTIAFDVADDAIGWAQKRFPASPVDYRTADLFDLPPEWLGAFDLVHECYTLQALPPQMLKKVATSIASLVRPAGTLLVYTRVRPNGSQVEGPPWPVGDSELDLFADLGFEKISETRFEQQKGERLIPHAFTQWYRHTDLVE